MVAELAGDDLRVSRYHPEETLPGHGGLVQRGIIGERGKVMRVEQAGCKGEMING